jgi:hypothetical protein
LFRLYVGLLGLQRSDRVGVVRLFPFLGRVKTLRRNRVWTVGSLPLELAYERDVDDASQRHVISLCEERFLDKAVAASVGTPRKAKDHLHGG